MNTSLDKTIDEVIGRETFENELKIFRHAQEVVKEKCLPTVVFPCSPSGELIAETPDDCLWKDTGCGLKCLDAVSTELNLWNL